MEALFSEPVHSSTRTAENSEITASFLAVFWFADPGASEDFRGERDLAG